MSIIIAIVSAGYVGLFGKIPAGDDLKEYTQSENEVFVAVETYLRKYEWLGRCEYERLPESVQTAELAGDKAKTATVVYVISFYDQFFTSIMDSMQYVVLTRERDHAFEVIAEGEVESYENGVLTVK